jgi:hypothetical protein
MIYSGSGSDLPILSGKKPGKAIAGLQQDTNQFGMWYLDTLNSEHHTEIPIQQKSGGLFSV